MPRHFVKDVDLDYAKIVSVSSNNAEFSLNDFNKVKINKKIFLVAVPTTAGSGSEVTEGAVIYKNKIKHSLEHKFITPDRYFLIPELVLKNSKTIKSNSGFDALSQSIDLFCQINQISKVLDTLRRLLKF